MLPYSSIKFMELKKACSSANLSKLLPENIRHVAVKGEKIYDNFIAAIEGVSDEIWEKLPKDVQEYYNKVVADEEIPEEQKELDFETEPKQDPEPESVPDPESETTPTPAHTAETVVEEEIEEPTTEPKKRPRKSTVTMTVSVDETDLIVEFKTIEKKKKFDLPPKGDRDKLKVLRKIAMDFATDCGATSGQRAAISKALNSAGYYIQKKG